MFVPKAHARRRSTEIRAFTLLELLVVIGIMLVLAVLTAISVGALSRDAKISSATNQIVATLGEARAIAIRDNAYVLVAFRMKRDPRVIGGPREPQQVEMVIAKWTGEVVRPDNISDNDVLAERFLTLSGVSARDLPATVRVAGPEFGHSTQTNPGFYDRSWITQPRFVGALTVSGGTTTYVPDFNLTEVGSTIGVMFGPDGRVLSRNPLQVQEIQVDEGSGNANAFCAPFVDGDGDDVDSDGFGKPAKNLTPSSPNNVPYWKYDEPKDRCLINLVPYLAVFDDSDLRGRFPTASWAGTTVNESYNPVRRQNITDYVEELADRISFNRYTGVPGVVKK